VVVVVVVVVMVVAAYVVVVVLQYEQWRKVVWFESDEQLIGTLHIDLT